MARIVKKSKKIQRMAEKLKVGAGVMRMINLMLVTGVVVHLTSCLWFLQSKF